MSRREKRRDVFSAPPGPEYWNDKTRDGWQLVAAEWEREARPADKEAAWVEEVPFGLMVSADCRYLVENPQEKEAMILMLEMIVADQPLSEIAESVNRRGLYTRSGGKWSQVDIFELLPRLVEVSSRIYPTLDWSGRRKQIFKLTSD